MRRRLPCFSLVDAYVVGRARAGLLFLKIRADAAAYRIYQRLTSDH